MCSVCDFSKSKCVYKCYFWSCFPEHLIRKIFTVGALSFSHQQLHSCKMANVVSKYSVYILFCKYSESLSGWGYFTNYGTRRKLHKLILLLVGNCSVYESQLAISVVL